MKLNELIYEEEYTSEDCVANLEITNVTTSREDIENGTLFVLVRSINFDVRLIINNIILARPAAIVTDMEIKDSYGVPILKVENARRILPFIFARLYKIDFSTTRFVGITGTNGKTTTARLLTSILEASGVKVGFIGTGAILLDGQKLSDEYYSMTTPDPNVLYKHIKEMQDGGCEVIVMEVSSHALYFDKVAPIPFEISAFTNLSHEHTDFHKTMEDYYEAKLKLFSNTRFGIFNCDDLYSLRAYESFDKEKRCVGIHHSGCVRAEEIKSLGILGTEYVYKSENTEIPVRIAMAGIYNVYNSAIAICAALELGISGETVRNAAKNLEAIEGRFEIVSMDSPTVIIDYAHTVEAFRKLLKTVNSLKKAEQKLTVVFGCGGERDIRKRPIMAKISERFADSVIVTTDNPRGECESEIISDILHGFTKRDKRTVITSRKVAIEHAVISADDDEIILVVGKGHERYSLDKNGYHPFDEREIILNAKQRRRESKI